MLRRIEADDPLQLAVAQGAYAEPVVAGAGQAELGAGSLPPDHPRWIKDSLALSQRARDIVARLRPIAIRILTFWDHRVRAATIGGLLVRVDPSGCYRLD